MKQYTIGYIAHDPAVHTRYLGPSLVGLKGEWDELYTSSLQCPAFNYNTMLELCQTPYLILTHQDVSFSPDLLECLDRTVAQVPQFGALGMVGVDSSHRYIWGEPGRVAEVDTLDCCFIVVRKDLGVRFDAATFDELHQYVEDYCGQLIRRHQRKVYTLLMRATGLDDKTGASFIHHMGHTFHERGSCWGRWGEYHRRLTVKWPGIQTT